MPQKKNPDIAELVRGKTGRVYGALNSLLATMKGIPLAYNKDMQEDKEWAFDAIDTAKGCLALFTGMLKTMEFHKERMEESAKHGFTNATDAADYLVNHGVPFRDAHGIVGQLVLTCILHIFLINVDGLLHCFPSRSSNRCTLIYTSFQTDCFINILFKHRAYLLIFF